MVLIGLILIALISLVLGLVLASAPWLIASLVASLLAAVWLWRRRDDIAPATAGAGGGRSARADSAPAVLVHERAGGTATTESAAARLAVPGDVWVIDGRPDYHVSDCSRLTGAAEPIPFEQAVEDGFTPCTQCDPQVDRTLPVVAAESAQVWVVDGRPDYHLAGCGELPGDAEQVPLAQAIEDGFAPCVVCEPDRAAERAGMAGATGDSGSARAGQPAEVFVIDGRPDYHLAGCRELTGDAEAIPFAQAVEDGFAPCLTCGPLRRPEEPTAAPELEPVAVAEESEAGLELEFEPELAPETGAAAEEPEAAAEEPEPELEAESEAVAEEPEPEAVAAEPEPEPAAEEPEPEPEAVAAEPEPEAAAEAPEPELEAEPEAVAAQPSQREVWVVAGRQRYHGADCVIITGQQAVSIPWAQATGDGFKPCSLCEPDAA